MSVIPIFINDASQTVTVSDSFHGHVGDVAFTDIPFQTTTVGQTVLSSIKLRCPVCDVESLHPIGGGANPTKIQKLFIHLLKAKQVGRSWEQAKALAKVLVIQQEGLGRWISDDVLQGDE